MALSASAAALPPTPSNDCPMDSDIALLFSPNAKSSKSKLKRAITAGQPCLGAYYKRHAISFSTPLAPFTPTSPSLPPQHLSLPSTDNHAKQEALVSPLRPSTYTLSIPELAGHKKILKLHLEITSFTMFVLMNNSLIIFSNTEQLSG
jgi:hypothetical protein